ncbi:MAG: hypothetical protein WDW38_005738 [Sanguina aurantia]
MDLSALCSATAPPSDMIRELYPGLQSAQAVFIHLMPLDALLRRCAVLEAMPVEERGVLWGVPFAAKDNVDVAGVPTTAACPAFSYVPSESAPALQALLDAGAIMVGKTNMDQFAAGLVGTRSPYGAPSTPFDSRFISGGSSSGSAVAVASGLVSFALGTDTAGSGRVPAGLCGCVGVKATLGSVSTVGLPLHSPPSPPATGFRFAVPSTEQLDWSSPGGDDVASQCQASFAAAVARLTALGGKQVTIDFSPLLEIAAMLYTASFVAERYSGIREFLESPLEQDPPAGWVGPAKAAAALHYMAGVESDERLLPVTRAIICGSGKYTAADVFSDMHKMAVLRAAAVVELTKTDVLLVPSALSHFTIAEVLAQETAQPPTWGRNAKMGRFTNFVNLIDMCGVSVPSGLLRFDSAALPSSAPQEQQERAAHLASTGSSQVVLPFGVTLLASAWQDSWVLGVAARMAAASGLKFDGKCTFFDGQPALPQGLGWFILCGLGAIFALGSAAAVWLDTRYSGEAVSGAEGFATAGRSINVGLTACDIVSKWTWAATLLQSSNVAFTFGISGPFWYAAGATVQVLLFAILAVEVKRKAPCIHTVLEVIRARWGTGAHIVFLCFCLATNVIVTSMLILGGASVMNALTGVNVYAAAFLIPIGVMFYTAQGGLKATFIASWAHVAIIYIALCTFLFMVYGAYADLGSPAKVYHNLRAVELKHPVPDNMGGSYVTMYSKSGIIFGIINIIGNFGTVFVDQAYWQSAIAARPSATYKGYLLGGLCWFAIPFTLATTMGLGARALDLPISAAESGAGLVPPAIAVVLLGQGGAFLMVLQLFMAVTASGSAEQIAVASLFAYDVYRPYINKNATSKQMVTVTRVGVICYGILSGVFATVLLNFGLSLGWVYLFMGIIIGSAVFPIACVLTWNKVSAFAAITSAVVGCPLAIMTWLITAAKLNDGEISLKTTGQDYPMLAGNLVALFFSAIMCIILTLIFPQNGGAGFDWKEFQDIPMIEQESSAIIAKTGEDSVEMLDSVLAYTYKTGGLLTFVLLVAWPLLALPAGVFSQGYFTFWVIVAIIWGVVASAICILLPLWEARSTFYNVAVAVFTCAPPASASSAAQQDISVAGKDSSSQGGKEGFESTPKVAEMARR